MSLESENSVACSRFCIMRIIAAVLGDNFAIFFFLPFLALFIPLCAVLVL